MPDAGYRMPDTRYKMPDTRWQTPEVDIISKQGIIYKENSTKKHT